MAGLTERLQILITADAAGAGRELQGLSRDADRALGQTEQRIDRVGQHLTRFGVGAVAASGIAAAGLYRLGNAASDLNEQTSRTRVVFGQASDVVEEFGRTAAQSAGLSNTAALEAAGSFGTLFRGIGQTEQQAAESSVTFSRLAGDLASFQNTSPEEAVLALGAALRGESEPIRRYGVLLDDATLKQRALSLGLIDTTTGTLPPAIRAQAAYAEILDQTTLAQGDFARTSDSAANQQRVLKAEFENLKASIGQGVLPVMQSLLGAVNGVFGAFNDLNPETRTAIGSFAAFGTAAIGVVGGVSLLTGQLIRLRDRFTSLDTTTGSRGLNRLGVATAGLTTLLGVGTVAYTQYAQRKAIATQRTQELVTALREEQQGLEGSVDKVLAATFAHDDWQEVMENTGLTVQQMAAFIRGEAVPAVDELGNRFDRVQLRALRDRFADAKDQAAALTATEEALGVKTAATTETIDDQTDSTEASTRAHRSWSETLSGVSARIDSVRDKLQRASEAQRDQNNAVLEGIDSRFAYEQSVDRTQQALEDLRTAQEEATAALRGHKATSDEALAAVEALDDATRDASRSIYEEAAASAAAQGAMAGSAEQAQIMRQYLQGIADTLAPGDPLRQRLNDYILDLSRIPNDVRTTATFDDAAARRSAASFGTFLEGVLSTAPNAEFASSVPGRAGGGGVRAGFAYRMGEYNTPEVLRDSSGRQYVIPGENGNVTPLRPTTSTGGGDVHIGQIVLARGGPREMANELGWLMRTRAG